MLELNILVIALNLINMSKLLIIKKKISKFNKRIYVSGDKSLSIRWVLLASQATGKSKCYNLLMSEDVLSALNTIKKLGIKVKKIKTIVKFMVMELMVLSTKKSSLKCR